MSEIAGIPWRRMQENAPQGSPASGLPVPSVTVKGALLRRLGQIEDGGRRRSGKRPYPAPFEEFAFVIGGSLVWVTEAL